MPISKLGAALTAATLTAAGLAAAYAADPSASASPAPSASAPQTVGSDGHSKTNAPQSVVLRNLPSAAAPAHTGSHPALGEDGKPAGSGLPSKPSTGSRPGGPATATAAPKTVSNGFDAVSQATSGCNCQPSDDNAAVGPNNIVEAVNTTIAVYDKSGSLQKSTTMNSFFNASNAMSDPHVLYDQDWNRWVVDGISADLNGTPWMFLAVSSTSDPTGGWWIYQFTYGSGLDNGVLDFPTMGMDQDAIIITTNNYDASLNYAGSTAFSLAKARMYNGFGQGFNYFGVTFGTTPPMVGGYPAENTNADYLIAPDDANNLMYVYTMTNTARASNLVYKGAIAYTWAAPSRQANQPGTTQTLDPSDGRIGNATTQIGGKVWFAHGVDVAGFPSINYGWVNPGAMTISTATAYHSGTSDDFNPAIGVQGTGGATKLALSWAYTDPANNIPVTPSYSIVGGSPVHTTGGPFRTGGSSTTFQYRFGDFASAWPEYNAVGSCGIGFNFLVVNQFFGSDGTWRTRIARVHPATC